MPRELDQAVKQERMVTGMGNIIIWGVGKYGKAYVDALISCGVRKDRIRLADSNSKLYNGEYQGIKIQEPEKAFGEKYDFVVVSVGEKYKEQILQLLKEVYNVSNEKILFSTRTLVFPRGGVYDIANVTLLDMKENMFGGEQYFDMWYRLYEKSLSGMNIGVGGNLEHSGELNVLRLLQSLERNIEIIFDVGANIGDYTKNLQVFFPNAQIHSFEPAKETFRTLADNIIGPNVILNNMGISNEMKTGTIYSDKENSGLASLYNRQLDYLRLEFTRKEQVELVTLDDYCGSHSIDRIDFLKMDIEGNEYNALLGATNLLKKSKIGAIQIETGGANMDSKTYFRDFWNLLHKDFDVFRVLQDGFKRIDCYEEKLECFETTNWLFVKRSW